MEDALISPEGFAILTGAGLVAATDTQPIYQHATSQIAVAEDGKVEIPEIICYDTTKHKSGDEVIEVVGDTAKAYEKANADVFVMLLKEGVAVSEPWVPNKITIDVANKKTTLEATGTDALGIAKGDIVLVDYYVKREGKAQQIEITADKFGGYYYIEASTLFRDEATGQDLPAEFIIPNGKVQSNFNFSMANSGDPSTFTFTVDAMPGYTKFDGTKKVLAVIQIIEDVITDAEESRPHSANELVDAKQRLKN